MCLNHELYFFWVSSLSYPNLLGKKCYVVVVVVVVCFNTMIMQVHSTLKKISYDSRRTNKSNFNHVELDWVFKLAYLPTILLSPLN